MTRPVPTPPGANGPLKTAVGAGGLSGLVGAFLIVLMEFGVNLSPNQVVALTTFVGILAPFLVAVTGNKAIANAWTAGVHTDPAELPSVPDLIALRPSASVPTAPAAETPKPPTAP